MQLLLPNGQTVHCFHPIETEAMFQEIFEADLYRRHGVTLRAGDCILDVGANIGMFLLFLQYHGLATTVYALEPIPPIFELLRRNAVTCPALTVHLVNAGLAREAGEATFMFYPRMSFFSTRYSQKLEEPAEARWLHHHILERIDTHPNWSVRSLLRLLPVRARHLLARVVRWYYFRGRQMTCRLQTLSRLLHERGIQRVDLLKIDAEYSEREILAGIAESDWPKIRQAVVEVHAPGDLPPIEEQFRRHGFRVTAERQPFHPTLTLVYALRDVNAPASAALA